MDFSKVIGFEWDDGNLIKNWEKHKISYWEAEQVFFNEPLVISEDEKHSKIESRRYALGQTDMRRKLMIVFTIRGQNIRVISARDMSVRERKIHKNEKENS